MVDDYPNLTVLPLEVKSGKDYAVHGALDKFLTTNDYNIRKAVVFSNEMDVLEKNVVLHFPIYYCMFYEFDKADENECIIPEITFDGNIL